MHGLVASDGGLQIRLLGPLDVRRDGEQLSLGGRRQRSLFALLALSAGTAVGPMQLIDRLWADEPPPTALNTVQVYVSRLRKLLTPVDPPSASPLRNVSGMYLLDVPPGSVDALFFEQRYDEGRARLGAGDAAAAAGLLRDALSAWRGSPAPDLAGTAAGDAVIARLEGLRLAALASRVEADAALGRHAELVPELQDLVRRHPFDERFVGQLMLALYRDHRQADALAAYAAASARLADELGVDPGPALRELHRRVLAQDSTLLTVTAPTPTPAAVPPVTVIDLDRESAGPTLIGRSAELAEAQALLADPAKRLVTLLGPGGAGKTRLAHELLDRAATGGVRAVFVELADVDEPAGLLPAVCRALAAGADRVGEPALDVAVQALGGQPALLVLDNLEHLVAAAGEPGLTDVHQVLERSPDLTVLTTSRTRLRLPGEQVITVGPLPVPAEGSDRQTTATSDSVRLFRDRAATAWSGFELTDANVLAVGELVRRLDGLPLAVELAAARVRVLPPEEILRRLDRRLQLLTGGSELLPARQRSMWAALDWSIRLLDPAERLALAQLSVFAGGWALEASEQVLDLGDPGVEDGAPTDPLDVLGRLVDKSLVVADGSGRLRLLETVRDFAVELLDRWPDDARATRARHRRFFADLADRLGPEAGGWNGTRAEKIRGTLDLESGNLTAAMQHAADPADGDPQQLGRLVAGQLGYWFAAGRLTEAERWVQVARDADLPLAERTQLLLSFANLSAVRGDLPTAAALLDEVTDGARRLDDPLLTARALAVGAMVDRHRDRAQAALSALDEALALAGRIGSDAMRFALENEWAETADDLGRTGEAVPVWQDGRLYAEETENPAQLSYLLANLARAALDGYDVLGDGTPTGQAQPDAARALAAQAMTAAEASGQMSAMADTTATVALVDLRTGRVPEAVAGLRRAVVAAHSGSQFLTLPDMVSGLGAALAADGDTAPAVRLLAAADAWRRGRGMSLCGRTLRSLVDAADARVPTALPAERLAVETRRGERTPFGSLRGLAMLDPGLRSARLPTVIDLRQGISVRE